MTKTISQIFDEFLADQKTRISHKTFLKYQSIISLYKSYLESYWPGHDGEYDKITEAGGTFCDTSKCLTANEWRWILAASFHLRRTNNGETADCDAVRCGAGVRVKSG